MVVADIMEVGAAGWDQWVDLAEVQVPGAAVGVALTSAVEEVPVAVVQAVPGN